MITVVESGVVFRNPRPHLRARHTWHPTVAAIPDGTLVVAFDVGEAVESLDYRSWSSRSTDGGRSWSTPHPILPPAAEVSNDLIRISATRSGRLVGFGGRLYRDDPEEGFVNRENLGYVRMDLLTVESRDGGRTWEGETILSPPLIGPGFEICHPIVELSDGRWLAPTSTWKGWTGEAPHGMQAIALVSRDQGHSWPEWISVVDQTARNIVSWEVGLCELPGGRLLAVVWSFDPQSGRSLPSRYALAQDGCFFGPSHENGLLAETAKLTSLGDGRVLCVYRRLDRPGLWADVVEIQNDRWQSVASEPLWQGVASGMAGAASAADELSNLKFGFPCVTRLPDGDLLLVFWCLEDEVRNVRWMRLRIG